MLSITGMATGPLSPVRGVLLFEHRRLRPLARLDALDCLILLRRNFALDLDLLVFDQARGFVCLFRRRVAAVPRRRRFRNSLCTGISQFALHPRFAEIALERRICASVCITPRTDMYPEVP